VLSCLKKKKVPGSVVQIGDLATQPGVEQNLDHTFILSLINLNQKFYNKVKYALHYFDMLIDLVNTDFEVVYGRMLKRSLGGINGLMGAFSHTTGLDIY
jgi:hypothetical protein